MIGSFFLNNGLLIAFVCIMGIMLNNAFNPILKAIDSEDTQVIRVPKLVVIINSIILLINLFLLLLIRWCLYSFITTTNWIAVPISVWENYILDIIMYCFFPATLTSIFVLFFSDILMISELHLTYGFIKRRVLKYNLSRIAKPIYLIFPMALLYSSFIYIFNMIDIIQFHIDNKKGLLRIEVPKGLAFPDFYMSNIVVNALLITIIVAFLHIIIKPKLILYRINNEQKDSLIFRILRIFSYVFLSLSIFIYLATKWVLNKFGNVTADMFMFQIRSPLKGTNNDFIISFLLHCIFPPILIVCIIFILLKLLKGKKYRILFQIKKKLLSFWLSPNKIIKFTILIMPIILLPISIYFLYTSLDLKSFYKAITLNSRFIEDNYVDPRSVDIVFPEKKRNLIYIFMESMETTYLSRELGGSHTDNIIPELSEMTNDNINFSNTEKLGGAIQVPYTGWTIGGMTAQHGGVPLKIPIEGNSYNTYSEFLPGAYFIGDILKKEGYNQTLIVGSDSDFGGRKSLYIQHGDYKILDLYTAPDDGIIPIGYKVWWGFEDKKLYSYARKELLELAKKDKPFNLTILTVDTHHIGGYRCNLCYYEFSDQYWDVAACASRQVSDFISWIKKQSFYDNTTIVISGDHLSMDPIVPQQMDLKYERTTLNIFVNSVIDTEFNKNRLFYAMDMFPTTLASMGVTIEGNKLALGTNLFSGLPTLLEEYGTEEVTNELNMTSIFYNSLY